MTVSLFATHKEAFRSLCENGLRLCRLLVNHRPTWRCRPTPLRGPQPGGFRQRRRVPSVAPEGEEAIKWGTPFFVEPRFLFAFSAHKAHLDFTPTAAGLEPFRKELAKHKTTKGTLQIPYNEPLPEDLVRKIAEHRLRDVRERQDDAFW
jgi:uncharacterized protein YdhG (YjbR/CyaY superfamily)